MKILFVSSKVGWGGVMSWMVQTAQGLPELNHEVWIISNPKSELNKNNYPTLNIIEKSLGANYSPLTILYLVRLIKKLDIDIIVSNIKKEVIAAGISAKIVNIPHVRRVGLPVDLNNKMKIFHKHLITHSIIPAKYLFKKAKETNEWLNKEEFTVIYNGRSIKEFDPNEINKIRRSWDVLVNEIVIGITVKLSPMKNVEGLIKAFSLLLKDFDNIKLVISGTGGEKKSLENLVSQLNLSEKIKFVGFTDNPQLTAAAYDIAVLNSFEEGFPNSLVEYMSVGTPVVTTNVGGVSEIVKNNLNALLIEKNNSSQLKDALKSYIIDENLRRKIGIQGKRTVAEKFSKERMVNEVVMLFERLINVRIS